MAYLCVGLHSAAQRPCRAVRGKVPSLPGVPGLAASADCYCIHSKTSSVMLFAGRSCGNRSACYSSSSNTPSGSSRKRLLSATLSRTEALPLHSTSGVADSTPSAVAGRALSLAGARAAARSRAAVVMPDDCRRCTAYSCLEVVFLSHFMSAIRHGALQDTQGCCCHLDAAVVTFWLTAGT